MIHQSREYNWRMEKLMHTKLAGLIACALALLLAFVTAGCSTLDGATADEPAGVSLSAGSVDESGEYSDRDSVALYIHEFGHLPANFVSKTKARAAGWVNTEGNLWDVLPGKSIGGSEFHDDENALPDAAGRRWTECDVNYSGGYRGPERIVFSNDGLVYYTPDHYNTFERLF